MEAFLITPFIIFLAGGGERDPLHNPIKPDTRDNSGCCSAKISVASIYRLVFVVILNHLFNLS
ncbi:hypothetical protein B9Z19DRAFT_1090900 [Tuber borchii]|uniref:Uncharacterized protein n=1 Tax=Tuber borchii TaxID=42251 RepID=A0A2T6ZI81_TUBBO|nr:hypothetical protein B9Z19DRAFT_1090900 [Tuber borchii]